ncbi:MAG TPA: J domain-containing protein [Phenylobacterium sp.]|jgi:curved DNA-binding protein|nr:J domain-containing protein [Phenylobacterium sp.]
MGRTPSDMTLSEARALLGVRSSAGPTDLRRAFRDAAKAAHPDRDGGSPDRFRRVMAAYRQLEEASAEIIRARPSLSPRPELRRLTITPLMAWNGGAVEHRTADGRVLRIRLPVGLRNGDLVRAGGEELSVVVDTRDGMVVRGDDLWITVMVPPRVLEEGGRVPVVTPIGRRILWVSKKAGERRLVRAPGLGLPPRGRRAQGCLFVRLAPKTGPLDSAARNLLRRFTAVWAV